MNNFIFKKSRTIKRIRISIHADGRVVVSAPWLMPEFLVRKFVAGKTDWINEKLAYFARYPMETSPWQGKRISSKEMTEYKSRALELVQNRLEYFNQFYNFEYKNVCVRNQKTRWGSCSKKKNLNFNFKIIFLTPEQQDYIVVHELCHLQEFNHGKKFWDLVAIQIPEHKKVRASIKKFRL